MRWKNNPEKKIDKYVISQTYRDFKSHPYLSSPLKMSLFTKRSVKIFQVLGKYVHKSLPKQI